MSGFLGYSLVSSFASDPNVSNAPCQHEASRDAGRINSDVHRVRFRHMSM